MQSTTRDIQVSVIPQYIQEQSSEEESYYFFAYTVSLKNLGEETVQLLSRHWIITDASGHVEEVRGDGVVGEQPILEPGESFEYTSFCPLHTSQGSMEGSYHMVNTEGDQFDIEIPFFRLMQDESLLN